MIRARVGVSDLMPLRAAALQVQARRGAQFAPPKSYELRLIKYNAPKK
ncbi:hypothetical protein [Deinococcus sp. ME38]